MSSVPSSRAARIGNAIATQRTRLLALARRYGGPGVDVEEVVQVASERALARSEQLRADELAEAWVARIARNAAVDELRRRAIDFVSMDERELPEQQAPAQDCSCVIAQLAALKPAYAEILRRVDVEGAAVTDVAYELGLSANNAMVRLHRARKALRARMAQHCGTTSTRSCTECGCEERGCCAQP